MMTFAAVYFTGFAISLLVNVCLDWVVARQNPNAADLLWAILWPLFVVLLGYLYLTQRRPVGVADLPRNGST